MCRNNVQCHFWSASKGSPPHPTLNTATPSSAVRLSCTSAYVIKKTNRPEFQQLEGNAWCAECPSFEGLNQSKGLFQTSTIGSRHPPAQLWLCENVCVCTCHTFLFSLRTLSSGPCASTNKTHIYTHTQKWAAVTIFPAILGVDIYVFHCFRFAISEAPFKLCQVLCGSMHHPVDHHKAPRHTNHRDRRNTCKNQITFLFISIYCQCAIRMIFT